MVFSLLLGKTTYNLKVVNLLICILTNPLEDKAFPFSGELAETTLAKGQDSFRPLLP